MTQFQVVSFEHIEKGHMVTGEFVCETSNAWQVAVKGKVQLVMKDEWKVLPPVRQSPFDNLFGAGGVF